MKTTTVEKLIWTLIYSGLFVLGLGLFMARSSGVLGTAMSVVGGVAMVTGVVLIYVRSRMKEEPPR